MWGRHVGIPVDESAIVVADSDGNVQAQIDIGRSTTMPVTAMKVMVGDHDPIPIHDDLKALSQVKWGHVDGLSKLRRVSESKKYMDLWPGVKIERCVGAGQADCCRTGRRTRW